MVEPAQRGPAARPGELLRLLLAGAGLISFHYADRLLAARGWGAWGGFEVLVYWLALGWLIYRQLYRFREAVRRLVVERILNPDLWLARWLWGGLILRSFSALAASVMAATLLAFVYTASPAALVILGLDAALFCWLDRRVGLSFGRVFQPDIARLLAQMLPLGLNVLILLAAITLLNLLDTSRVFPLMSPELPNFVADTIHHSWPPFRWFARTTFFLELNVTSLRSVPDLGIYLYLTVFLTSISLVPFVSATLAFKSALPPPDAASGKAGGVGPPARTAGPGGER